MGVRFSKRIKIAPGLKINVGLGGASITAGVRGASINVGKRGIYANAGIPGTGFSYRQKISSSGRLREDRREAKRLAQQIAELRQLEQVSSISLSLTHDGKLEVAGKNGMQLSGKDLKLAYEINASTIQDWIEAEAMKISGDSDLIENIHLDSMDVNDFPEFDIVEFCQPFPVAPDYLAIPVEPKYSPPKKLPGILAWIKPLLAHNENKLKKYEEHYGIHLFKHKADAEIVKNHNHKLSLAHDESVANWNKEKIVHDSSQKELGNEFDRKLREDESFMDSVLEQAIHSLEWPRETLLSYEFRNRCAEVYLDIDLPEIEDLPTKQASVAANGRKINIKNKAVKTLQFEYLKHISGIALRSACCVFASLPSVSLVVVSGYSQRLEKGTGKINDEYLYSVRFTRNGLEELDFDALEHVDPAETICMFEHRRKITTTGLIKPISPFD